MVSQLLTTTGTTPPNWQPHSRLQNPGIPTAVFGLVWQPHTYTRTRTLEADFIRALNTADQAVILKIYAAREADPGYSAVRIAEALPAEKAMYCETFDAASTLLIEKLVPGDVVIVFSAGDATEVSKAVLNGLEQRERED